MQLQKTLREKQALEAMISRLKEELTKVSCNLYLINLI